MKLAVLCVLSFAVFGVSQAHASGKGSKPSNVAVPVSGHVTKTGTYVAPHYRTAPDHTKVNNWSSKPNVNPYSGKAGSRDPYASGR